MLDSKQPTGAFIIRIHLIKDETFKLKQKLKIQFSMHCVKTNNYFSVAGTSYLVVIRISALVGHIESRRSLAFSANHQLQCGDEIYNYYKQKLTSESYGWLVEKIKPRRKTSN